MARLASLLRTGLSPLLALAVVMTFSGALVAAAALTLAIRGLNRSTSPGLFDAYADLFPGQPADVMALAARGFSCQLDPPPSPGDVRQRCLLSPETGPFRGIAPTIVDGLVIRTEFSLSPDTLSVGDLILSFGQPEVKAGAILTRLNWSSRHAVVILPSEDRTLSYFQPVSLIAFSL